MEANQRFGRWTLVRQVGDRWLCQCDCGTRRTVATRSLKEKRTQSCGCKRNEIHNAAMALSFPEVRDGVR